jgi:hypothetical protein
MRWRLRKLLEDHDRSEADLEALAAATREDKPCGCHWVPCDKHVDRLERVIRKDGEPK